MVVYTRDGLSQPFTQILSLWKKMCFEINLGEGLGIRLDQMQAGIASFPGLPRLQLLIACSIHVHASNQKLEPGKAWERGLLGW